MKRMFWSFRKKKDSGWWKLRTFEFYDLHFRNELSRYSNVFSLSINSEFHGRICIPSQRARHAYWINLNFKLDNKSYFWSAKKNSSYQNNPIIYLAILSRPSLCVFSRTNLSIYSSILNGWISFYRQWNRNMFEKVSFDLWKSSEYQNNNLLRQRHFNTFYSFICIYTQLHEQQSFVICIHVCAVVVVWLWVIRVCSDYVAYKYQMSKQRMLSCWRMRVD